MLTKSQIEDIEANICRQSNFEFLKSMNLEFSYIWYHKLISEKVQDVIEGRIKKLMVFVPPQHNKSTIASINSIAWAFGKNPNLKVIHSAYGVGLVEDFSRQIQRLIDSEFYAKVFPSTTLNNKNARTQNHSYIKTVEKWEIVNYKGMYYCAGVGGGISGKACDLGIIDDPIKGAEEAASKTIRDKVWNWYIMDFCSRLHNNSKQIIIQTRWHDDDLSGRILAIENDWEVINLPAIKRNELFNYDIRQIGEALYPAKHNLESLLQKEHLNPKHFAALYQQSPSVEGGNIVKSEWFNEISKQDFDKFKNYRLNFFIDTAFTDKQRNDPSAIICTAKINNIIYIIKAEKVRKEFTELVQFIKRFVNENKGNQTSAIYIEPKANGLSIIQTLKKETQLNILPLPNEKHSKEVRLDIAAPTIASGKVYLITDNWNTEFKNEICSFPNAKHDEYVDLISYAIKFYNVTNSYNVSYIN